MPSNLSYTPGSNGNANGFTRWSTPRWSILGAILLASCVLLPLLGHRPLTGWDEGIYAEVSREMLSNGCLVPHWNHQVWFEKPPLMVWITALIFRIFGVGEFQARLASALSGVAVVGLLHACLLHRKSLLTAWLSTVFLLSTFGFLHVCRVGEMDALLTLGCLISLVGLSWIEQSEAGGWTLFWIGFAVAVMTKGAASIVLLPTLLLTGIIGRWRLARFNRGFWLGLVGFLAAILPWHLYIYHRFGALFLNEYLGYHVLTRAITPLEGHITPWWFFFKVLLVSAPPYALLLPFALVDARRRVELRVWWIFLLVVMTLFSIAHTRLPHYIAPIYPVVAALCAIFVADRIAIFQQVHSVKTLRLWIGAGLAGVTLFGLTAGATNHARRELHVQRAGDTGDLTERESDRLLTQAFASPRALPTGIEGPLLLWRRSQRASMATCVFYSGRPVQQVQVGANGLDGPRDRYEFDPHPLDEAIAQGPRFILAETTLLAHLPAGVRYTRIVSGPSMELGVVARLPRSAD